MTSAHADLIHVPQDFPTIQAAIDSAVDGDEVVVAIGVYAESIDFVGKNIVVRSTDATDPNVVSQTIIDGAALDTVVTMSAGTLSGFTIRNGAGAGFNAGGVEATGTAVVSWNLITANTTEQRGGGVGARDSVIVQYNRITGNTAVNRAGGVNARDNAVIIDNLISGNSAIAGGGGISTRGSPLIRNNTIVANNSAETGEGVIGGGGILADESPVILNNIIAFGEDGVGLHVPEGGAAVVDYNCIYGNLEGNYGGDGAAAPNDVNADPELDRDGLHLLEFSPCVNNGDPSVVPVEGESDIDGQARILRGRIDIGADELPCSADANNDGTVDPLDSGFVLARLGCSVNAGDPLCDAADANSDNVVDPLDVGYVLSRFGSCD